MFQVHRSHGNNNVIPEGGTCQSRRVFGGRRASGYDGDAMASDQKFVDYVCDQMAGAGEITSRKMFGEFAVYCDEKVVALVCDNRLFVKPTLQGRELFTSVVEAPPYTGAKPHFLIDDGLDDAGFLAKLVQVTAGQLPKPKAPKPKVKKK